MNDIENELAEVRADVERLREAIGHVFLGGERVVEELLLGLFAGGHVLLEGVPGLGKTTLVRTLAGTLDLAWGRIQFTPDLMPGDILGTRILEEDPSGNRRFAFERGPIFTQVLLADEINRATPRTQSALLEAMQERAVTLFGERHQLQEPFFLVATQNPIEMEGTYPLPEAQLDRFLLKVTLPFPETDELQRILAASAGQAPTPGHAPAAVLGSAQVLRVRELVREIPASSDVLSQVAALVLATHPGGPGAPEGVRRFVRHGASPRGGQAVIWAAKARALLRGRVHVASEDLRAVAAPALRHRLILGYEGEAAEVDVDELVQAALESALA